METKVLNCVLRHTVPCSHNLCSMDVEFPLSIFSPGDAVCGNGNCCVLCNRQQLVFVNCASLVPLEAGRVLSFRSGL